MKGDVNKGPSNQGARTGMGKATDQAFQELSPPVVQTIGHGCERDELLRCWCAVLHVPDFPAERQSQGPKLKDEGRQDLGRGLETGAGWGG